MLKPLNPKPFGGLGGVGNPHPTPTRPLQQQRQHAACALVCTLPVPLEVPLFAIL